MRLLSSLVRRHACTDAKQSKRGFEQDYEFVALSHPEEYPFNEGRLISNKGINITAHEYDDHFLEEHVAYSNALHSIIKGRGAYFTGPLARYNLNFDQLSPLAQEASSYRRTWQGMPQSISEHHRAQCRNSLCI